MQSSCAENSLIFEWLALIRRQYRLYNIDNSHQCHTVATHVLHLITPEEEELRSRKRARLQGTFSSGSSLPPPPRSTIIQPFEWAPQFYGCVVCGRYHICHRNERECEVILNTVDQQLTCRHSHQLLRQATSYELGNYEDLQQFEHESCNVEKEIHLGNSNSRTRREFRAAPRLYSNGRLRQPLCELEALEQLEKREARAEERAEAHRLQRKEYHEYATTEDCDLGQDFHGDEMIVEEEHQSKVKNWHDNRLYWNHYFGFLLEENVTDVAVKVTTTTPTTRLNESVPAMVRPLELVPRHTLDLDSDSCQLIHDTIEEVVARLMKTHYRQLQRTQPLQIDALNRQIVASLTQPVERILILCRHTQAPGNVSIRNACIALLLLGMTESFYGGDSYGQRIEIWHRHPWLSVLHGNGVTSQLFAPPRRKNHRPMDSVKKKQRYDLGQIKQAWSQTEQALALYRHSHSLWLRRFVLGR